jgi:gamma-glutamyltranspeptidase/glutathione hydrolase
MLEKAKILNTEELSADEFHLLAEVEARAFRGRSLLGDPDYTKNPVPWLLSDSYLNELVHSLSPKKVVSLKPLSESQSQEAVETTHYSVLTADGTAVAITTTLNGDYGSGVTSRTYGIALNNEMDDFTTRPNEPNMYGLIQGQANSVEPGKRPLSSMSPTIVEKDGKAIMAIGAPGGPRIITGVLQVLYRVLGRGMDLDLAVQAPRVHHQFIPQKVLIDAHRFSPEVLKALREKGHVVEEDWMGRVYAVRLRPDGVLEAAFDARGEGAVGGF